MSESWKRHVEEGSRKSYKLRSSKKKSSNKSANKSTLGEVFEANKVKKHEEYVVTLINNISKLEERLNCVETQLNCLNKKGVVTSLNQITVLDEIRSPTMLCPYDSDNDSDEEIVSIEFRYLQHQKDLPSTGPGLVKYDPNYDYKNCKFKSF